MDKLIPLKEIVGFLPYQLKIESSFGQENDYFLFRTDNYETIKRLGEYAKPVVRPLHDLTKEIIHNGETFVPIIELAKLFFIAKSAVKEYKDVVDHKEYGIQVSCYYDKDRYGYYSIDGDIDLIFHNEARVIEKLREWHFDIYDWIKDGKAISINDL